MSKKMQNVWVVIPTYNEKNIILTTISEVSKYLPDADILVVDDSSPDGTADIVDGERNNNKKINLLVREEKEGLGLAYFAGFKEAISRGADIVVQMDADLSHDPQVLPEFVKRIENGDDLVIGSRYVSGGGTVNWPVHRKAISYFGSKYASLVLNLKVNDVTGGYKAWSAAFLEKIIAAPLVIKGFGFQIEMNFRARLMDGKISETPIVFKDRDIGGSKMSKKIFIEAMLGIWKLRFKGKKIFNK